MSTHMAATTSSVQLEQYHSAPWSASLDALTQLLHALQTTTDAAAVCSVLSVRLPHIIPHSWAMLLPSVAGQAGWRWRSDMFSALEAEPYTSCSSPMLKSQHPVFRTTLRRADAALRNLLMPLAQPNERCAVLPLDVTPSRFVLCIGGPDTGRWTQRERQLLQLIGASLQLALQRVQLEDEVDRSKREAQLLDSIRAMISQTLDLPSLLARVVDQVAEYSGYSLVCLYLLDGDVLRLQHQVGLSSCEEVLPMQGVMADALRQQRSIWIEDVAVCPEFIAVMPHITSEIVIVIRHEAPILGILNVKAQAPARLDARDFDLLQMVGVEVGGAIERARVYTATVQQAQQLKVIERLRAAIAAQLDTIAVGTTLVASLRDFMGFKFVSLFLLQQHMLRLQAYVGYAQPQLQLSIHQGLIGLCVRKEAPLLVNDVTTEPDYLMGDENIRAGMYVPLIYNGHTLGAIGIESYTQLSNSDFEVVTLLNEQIAAALEQSRRIAETQRAQERITFLHQLLTMLNQAEADNWRAVWQSLAYQLAVLVSVDQCAIGVFDDQHTLQIVSWASTEQPNSPIAMPRFPESAFNPAVLEKLQSGSAVLVDNLADDWQYDSLLYGQLVAWSVAGMALVPVLVDSRLRATITLLSAQPRPWMEEDITLLEAVAQHLAVALRQADLRLQEVQHRRELELVYQTALDITAQRDVQSVLQAIVDRACALLNADCATLYLLLPGGAEAELRVGVNIPGPLLGSRIDRTFGIVGHTLQSTDSCLVADYATWPRRDPSFDFANFGATLAAPLLTRHQPIGVLTVSHLGTTKQFRPTDQRLIELLVAQAAQAIETTQLLEDVRRRNVELEAVYATALTLSVHHEPKQILQTIAERALDLMKASAVSVHLLNAATNELVLTFGVNVPAELFGTRVKLGEGISGQAAQARRGVTVDNYANWPHRPAVYEHLPYTAVLSVPLLCNDQVLGTLSLARMEPGTAFTPRDVQLMALFASQGAQVVAQAQRLERERMFRADAERSLAEIKAVLTELDQTHERMSRIEKFRLLGELASEVAHDFNNALVSILGNAQILILDEVDPERMTMLQAIEAAARDSATMVKRIQEFGRVQHSTVVEMIDINLIVESALVMTQSLWRDVVEPVKMLQSRSLIQGSTSELRRVLMNLIVNAIDAMPDGGTVSIATRDDRDRICITVADSGIGMSPDVQSRIFDPFFTTKIVGMGTGLGLSICHQIITRHGGTITVESSPGNGTTFTICLPTAKH